MKKYLLLTILILGMASLGFTQPWTYDFGTGTGSFSSSTASTSFLPAPPSGTARVRVGTNPGSIVLANPGLSALGSNTELQITSNTGSTSTTKFSVYDYTSGKAGYIKFYISFNGGTNGVYKFSLGDGATFSDNNAMAAAQIFAGIEWTFGASSSISYKVLNASTYGTTGISNPSTLFVQNTSTVYLVEVYANNTTSSTNYTRSGTSYNLTNATWDLWVDGVRVGTGLAKGGLGNDVVFDSFAFNHQTSATSPGTIYIDDIQYSNSLPTTPTFTSTQDGNWNTGTTWLGGNIPTAGAIVNIGHNVTINTGGGVANSGTININNGGTLSCATTGGATLTGSGTVNINAGGTLSIEEGGWPGNNNTFVYAATGTLKFNNSTGPYGINSDNFWPVSNGPQNVNVAGAGGIQMNVARTVGTLFQTSAGVLVAQLQI